jgi:hypothetical protein
VLPEVAGLVEGRGGTGGVDVLGLLDVQADRGGAERGEESRVSSGWSTLLAVSTAMIEKRMPCSRTRLMPS